MVCPPRARINPHWQLDSSWTNSNVGHINNEEGKNRWYKFFFDAQFARKGDFYSKIAKVSILLLLLCAVAFSIKEKETMRFIINYL